MKQTLAEVPGLVAIVVLTVWSWVYRLLGAPVGYLLTGYKPAAGLYIERDATGHVNPFFVPADRYVDNPCSAKGLLFRDPVERWIQVGACGLSLLTLPFLIGLLVVFSVLFLGEVVGIDQSVLESYFAHGTPAKTLWLNGVAAMFITAIACISLFAAKKRHV